MSLAVWETGQQGLTTRGNRHVNNNDKSTLENFKVFFYAMKGSIQMVVTINFIRRGRISHIRAFEIKNVDLFITRLNSQFDEYELMVNEVDITDVESEHYDKYEHGRWYTYTGRMVYIVTAYRYGKLWWYEYADEEGNIRLF